MRTSHRSLFTYLHKFNIGSSMKADLLVDGLSNTKEITQHVLKPIIHMVHMFQKTIRILVPFPN